MSGGASRVARVVVERPGPRARATGGAGRSAAPRTLAASSASLVAEWHPTKNGDLTPATVTTGSHLKAWWRCSRDPEHVWQAEVCNRARLGRGCPMCAGKVATPRTSLLALHPGIASEWHPTRNGDVTPAEVVAGSGIKAWWLCSRNAAHTWSATVANRTLRGTGCPTCAGRLVTVATSLQGLFPSVAAEWHPTKNGELKPAAVAPKSSKRHWWRCATCRHEWRTSVAHRTARGDGCPACSGRAVGRNSSLAAQHPRLSAEWHPTKNGKLTPSQVVAGSHRRAWWRCSKDRRHVWDATISSRSAHGAGCPVCAGRVVTRVTSLAALFPDVAAEWHPSKNGSLRPEDVTPGTHRLAWWRCSVDSAHEWQARVQHRTRAGSSCPMCANLVATPATCLRSQFPSLAAEWHPTKNGRLTPEDVVPGSGKRVWWRCALNRHHVWDALVCERARKGRGCPACRGAYGPRKQRKPSRLGGPTLT